MFLRNVLWVFSWCLYFIFLVAHAALFLMETRGLSTATTIPRIPPPDTSQSRQSLKFTDTYPPLTDTGMQEAFLHDPALSLNSNSQGALKLYFQAHCNCSPVEIRRVDSRMCLINISWASMEKACFDPPAVLFLFFFPIYLFICFFIYLLSFKLSVAGLHSGSKPEAARTLMGFSVWHHSKGLLHSGVSCPIATGTQTFKSNFPLWSWTGTRPLTWLSFQALGGGERGAGRMVPRFNSHFLSVSFCHFRVFLKDSLRRGTPLRKTRTGWRIDMETSSRVRRDGLPPPPLT